MGLRKRLQGPPEIGEGLDEAEDPQFVTALARGLEVLKCFHAEGGTLTNLEIAKRTGLPKPTVSRLAYTLARLGHLSYGEDGRYSLGAGVLSLGFTYLRRTGVAALAKPLMQELADQLGMPVAIGTRDRLSMIYVDVAQSDNPITLAISPGTHIKLATSAMGRAYIAGLTEPRRQALYARLERHERDSWPLVHRGIDEAVRDYQSQGCCFSFGNWKETVNAVAVPVSLPDGSDVFAINCGGAALYLTEERIRGEVAPRMVEIAAQVSKALAHWGANGP
jgi:DNA-binding IclR family transcriptional regulator